MAEDQEPARVYRPERVVVQLIVGEYDENGNQHDTWPVGSMQLFPVHFDELREKIEDQMPAAINAIETQKNPPVPDRSGRPAAVVTDREAEAALDDVKVAKVAQPNRAQRRASPKRAAKRKT